MKFVQLGANRDYFLIPVQIPEFPSSADNSDKLSVKQAKLIHEWSEFSYIQVESEVRAEIITLYNTLQTTYQNYQ
jgi:hypothetical protein